MPTSISRLVTVAVAATALGCGGGRPATPSSVPASISVSGFNGALSVGGAVQLVATVVLSDRSTRNVTVEAVWRSLNPAVATVSNAGLVTAVGIGTVEIRATYQGLSGSESVSVSDQGPPPPGLTCGVERWAVKTLSDPSATSVNLSQVVSTSIRSLNLQPAHCSGLPGARTFTQEFQVFQVEGRITFVRLEDDRDYHVAIADPADSGSTIIVEVPDPVCQGLVTSPFFTTLSSARSQFDNFRGGRTPSLLVGEMVRVRGVGFYDFNHGQNGRSQSCMELHPVLGFEKVQ